MPLHADDWLMLSVLNGLDDAIGGGCRYTEAWSGRRKGLMVERVDSKMLLII